MGRMSGRGRIIEGEDGVVVDELGRESLYLVGPT